MGFGGILKSIAGGLTGGGLGLAAGGLFSFLGAREGRKGVQIPPEIQALMQANLELTQRSGPAFEAIRTSVGRDLTSFIQEALRGSRRGQRRTGISAIDPERTSEFASAVQKQKSSVISQRIGAQLALNQQTLGGMAPLMNQAQGKFDFKQDLYGRLGTFATGAGEQYQDFNLGDWLNNMLGGKGPPQISSPRYSLPTGQWASGTSNARSSLSGNPFNRKPVYQGSGR